MKLATWNVNSIRARHDAVLDWIARTQPDVLCMQETKVEDDDFPTDELLRLGYAVAMAGQKTYNGVAIVSRLPMTDVAIGLHDEPDAKDKRLIRATIEGEMPNLTGLAAHDKNLLALSSTHAARKGQ